MKDYLGDEYDDFIASYDKPEVKSLRLNTLAPGENLGAICNWVKTNDGLLPEELSEDNYRIPWCRDGMIYSISSESANDETNLQKFRPGKHPYHEAGAYYIQEPSAMAPVEYLSVEPGDRVLDLCAAPGGKSTQIAAKLKGEGILITNEIMPDRAKILSENIERMGVRNALVISEDPRNISDRFAGFFDKVLVDAPCSGEGMFRRSQVAIDEWSLENVELCAKRQLWILDEAVKMLAPGGTLVYSTCTFSPEEDEEQMKALIERCEDMALCDMTVYDGMRRGTDNVGIRLFPHLVKGEGHFVCKLKKKNYASEDGCKSKNPSVYGYEPDLTNKDKENLKEMFSFFKEVMEDSNEEKNFLKYMSERRITRFKDQIYLLPKECPTLKGLKVLRPGLHLGTILKNRFEPGHALAAALSSVEVRKKCLLSGKNQEIYKYFRGETFVIDESMTEKQAKNDKISGWYVIFVDNFSAGWGKITNFIVKNHYPKGLRIDIKQ